MWDGMSGIIESAAAYVFLGDRLDKASEYLGLALTTAGIILLKSKG
jgi:multidrug transporter EmrE-like cation transporter